MSKPPPLQVPASVRRVTVRGLCELSMFDRFSFKREREFSKKPEFIFFSFLSYFQSVQLRDQRGWTADVPGKPYFSSLLQQNHPLLGLVSCALSLNRFERQKYRVCPFQAHGQGHKVLSAYILGLYKIAMAYQK